MNDIVTEDDHDTEDPDGLEDRPLTKDEEDDVKDRYDDEYHMNGDEDEYYDDVSDGDFILSCQ